MSIEARSVGCAWRPTRPRPLRVAATALLLALAVPAAHAQVYRWVDAEGVIHLSSEKPPAGVKAERIQVGSTSRSSASAPSAGSTGAAGSAPSTSPPRPAPASNVPAAEREALLSRLRTRECVIALEALDRKTSGAEPTSAAELRRLKQTTELNCSEDPARRRREEELASRLRMANSPACDQARDQLWQMLEPGSGTPRERVRSQQTYVDEYCTPPVR
jgi:hypothetical protein